MANDGACKHVLVIDDGEDHLLALLLRTEKPCRFTTDVAFGGHQGVPPVMIAMSGSQDALDRAKADGRFDYVMR